MKYTDLKAKLKQKLENCYLIFGEDRFLCFDALKKIEDAAAISITEMNQDIILGDKANMKDILSSCNLYPFGDTYRLVIVKNYVFSKSKDEQKQLSDYLSQPLSSTILVFFNPGEGENLKNIPNLTLIDCNKIDAKLIEAYAKNFLAKNQIDGSDEAVSKLVMFCGFDMSRLTNELEKLSAFLSDDKKLTVDVVEKYVSQDKEFQVFQLAEFLAKGDAKNATDLVDSFSYKPGSAFSIIAPLHSNYRRALFVSLNKDKSQTELANILGVKEYAIRLMQNQIRVFSPKKLKKIVSMIADYDRKIKIGEMKENVAIKLLVFNILNIRGQND